MTNKEKVHNAINDPAVTFFLFPTPKLQEILTLGEHPYAKAMTPSAKAALIDGYVLPVSKEDVLGMLDGTLKPDRHWLMTTGEIRVSGAAEIIASKLANQKPQG